MKVAILHDYFDEIGGAELSLLVMAQALKATIVTTNFNKKKIDELGFQDISIVSIGKIPQQAYVKQLMARLRFFFCNFRNNFDLFIFGGVCSIFAAKIHQNNVWYCFSPERRLYDLHSWEGLRDNTFICVLKKAFSFIDQYFVKHIQKTIAISETVAERVQKYYGHL